MTRIRSDISVDGMLDEEAWHTAPKIGGLIQREPQTGEPASERTDVTLLHNDNYLYIGIIAYDSEPNGVIGSQMARDADLNSDDRIEILLDTYRDQRTAYYFATNPVGALVDGLVYANGQLSLEWDAIWTVRTRHTSRGWSAELAIPFRSLGFSPGRNVWGFNIRRVVHRKLEDSRWTGTRLQTEFEQVSEAGEITGLDGLTQGVGIDVRPFTGGSWLHTGATGHNATTGKPGLDIFYNFTPNVKLTATVNTDFAETEVDARQINLSRFSLFFPEKRSFFLENAGVFSFSNTSVRPPGGIPDTRSQVIPFFSRQIGLLAREEVPIDFGLKLTGTASRTDFGLLGVRTREVSGAPQKTFLVGRVKRNLLRQSYVGAVFTQGHPGLPITARTYGADVRLATSQFLGDKNLSFNAYGLRSVNEGYAGRDWSYGVSLEYPNDLVETELIWREIQENFRPALGFVSRRNVRLFRVGGRYNPRPENFLGVQQIFSGLYYTRFTRLDNGQVESWALNIITPTDWHFWSGDSVHSVLWPTIQYERLFAPFEIAPGVVLPAGEYRFTRWQSHVMTASKRRWRVRVKWALGRYWSGHADEVSTELTLKIPPRLTMTFDTDQTFARLPEGNFVARILSGQVNYSASPFLSFSNLVQFDNLSRNLGWQTRMRWILRPGNDVFLVFGHGWIQEETADGLRFRTEESKVSVKFQYTLRF